MSEKLAIIKSVYLAKTNGVPSLLVDLKNTMQQIYVILEIRKVLTKIGKESNCEDVNLWIRACDNHLSLGATSTSSGDGNVILAKFLSFLGHVLDKHENLNNFFNKCAHDEEIETRQWLDESKLNIKFAKVISPSRAQYVPVPLIILCTVVQRTPLFRQLTTAMLNCTPFLSSAYNVVICTPDNHTPHLKISGLIVTGWLPSMYTWEKFLSW